MKVVILDNAEEVAKYGCEIFVKQINKKPDSVLGLATGSTPLAMYNELIKANEAGDVNFGSVSSFNLDEYLGLPGDHPQSYRYFMNDKLFNHINIEKFRTHVPPGDANNPIEACAAYEKMIEKAGGIDVQLLGIGRNGHIGFNEPSSSLASRTRVKTLTKATVDDNARFFNEGEFQPQLSITMGIGTILEAKKVVLLATGKGKADAVKQTVEGPLSAACPASALQFHQNVIVIVDEAAASNLGDPDFYKYIEAENRRLEKHLGL